MAEAWRVVVQQRAREVEVRCVRAHGVLSIAAVYLAPPMLVDEAEAARGRIQAVLEIAASASEDLNGASNAAMAARLLTLRGAAADPRDPLRFIEQIPGDYHDARLALRLFQRARGRAVDAFDAAGRCRGHLHAALNLLNNNPDLPRVDVYLRVQRAFASDELEDALASAVESSALAVVANWLVR